MGKTHVLVQILDVNDNSPQFQNPVLAVPMLRNASANDMVTIFRALDEDSDSLGTVRYSLYNVTDVFNIGESGKFLLALRSSKMEQKFFKLHCNWIRR